MGLVLFGFGVPDSRLKELREEFDGIFEFQKFDPRHFDPRQVRSAEVLVLTSSNAAVISEASSCRWVHSLSAGVDDYLSVDRFRKPGAPVLTNSAGAYGTQISEHVFAMILAFSRGIKSIVLNQERRRWAAPSHADQGAGLIEIGGLTMGVIGLGHIGLEIAKTAKAFGLVVLGLKRSVSTEFRIDDLKRYVDEVFPAGELGVVLPRADIVVNTLPLTNDTKNLFDRVIFSKFKTGAMFINVGRGATVVEGDLVEALHRGTIGYAALDVFAEEPLAQGSPLWKMGNVIVSPHCAGLSERLSAKAYSILKDNLAKYSKNVPLSNLVDTAAGY